MGIAAESQKIGRLFLLANVPGETNRLLGIALKT